MEKKKAKAEAREEFENYLKYKKLKEQEKEKEFQERELKRKEEKDREEEILNKIREEQQLKEEEEYAQWKDKFTIVEEGTDKVDFDENVLNNFIRYIKLRKVVSMEDLSGQFKLSSSEVVEWLNDLEKLGKICGIIDDRGKYIYLTDNEVIVSCS